MLTYLSALIYVAYSTKHPNNLNDNPAVTPPPLPPAPTRINFHEGALLDQDHIKSCLLVKANHPTLEIGFFREQVGFKKPACDRNIVPSV